MECLFGVVVWFVQCKLCAWFGLRALLCVFFVYCVLFVLHVLCVLALSPSLSLSLSRACLTDTRYGEMPWVEAVGVKLKATELPTELVVRDLLGSGRLEVASITTAGKVLRVADVKL